MGSDAGGHRRWDDCAPTIGSCRVHPLRDSCWRRTVGRTCATKGRHWTVTYSPSDPAVRVGLAGAGQWAKTVHAPLLAEGPETRLVGIWSRRPEASRDLATIYDCPVYADFDALVDATEVVSFAVSPTAQPALARRVAGARRHALLEKPLALTLPEAEDLAACFMSAESRSVLLLTYRFSPEVQ